MSDDPDARNRISGMTRIELLVVVAIILMCLGVMGFWLGQAFLLLLIGWVKYPLRVANQITIEWISVITACVALILFSGGVHWFGKWFAGTNSTAEKPRHWSINHSTRFVLLILFAFVAGTSMIGIVHQVTWLSTTEKQLLNASGRTAARRSASRNNLKQLGLALHFYHDTHATFATSTFTSNGEAYHSWQTYLLPFVDQRPLYEQIDQDVPWTHPTNQEHFNHRVEVYLNPGVEGLGDEQPSPSHYAGNIRVLRPNQESPLDAITDGASNTILGGEVNARFKAWGDPTNLRDPALGINRSPSGFGSPYPGGGQFLFADGNVRFLSEDIDPAVLKALATPEGGEEISDDAY